MRRISATRRLVTPLVSATALTALAASSPAHAIVGGTEVANTRAFPSVLTFIGYAQKPNGEEIFQLCGAVYLGNRRALTAAHCAYTPYGPISTCLIRSRSIQWAEDGELVRAQAIYPHPQFDEYTFRNDIAVVVLEKDLPQVPPATLATADFAYPGNMAATAVGWGTWDPALEEIPSKILRAAQLTTLDRAECKKVFKALNPEESKSRAIDSWVCARSPAPQQAKGVHNGDSGGPLLADVAGKQIVLGVCVTSYEVWKEKELRDLTSIYLRVTPFIDWINSIPSTVNTAPEPTTEPPTTREAAPAPMRQPASPKNYPAPIKAVIKLLQRITGRS